MGKRLETLRNAWKRLEKLYFLTYYLILELMVAWKKGSGASARFDPEPDVYP
jgi:hypothetical protein